MLKPVEGRTYDTYRADYAKGAFCSAIGGACSADLDPENSYFQNPAALVASESGFSFDGDYNSSANLEPGMKSGNDVTEAAYMGGIAYGWKKFGIGVSFNGRTDQVKSRATLFDDQGKSQSLNFTDHSTRLEFRVPLAYRISKKWVVGIGINALIYNETIDVPSDATATIMKLDKLPSFSLTLGALFTINPKVTVGSWLKTPQIFYENIQIVTETFGNSISYSEDLALRVPWIWANGVSWLVGSESSLFFDLDIIGSTPDGFLLTYDTFAGAINEKSLRAKGHAVSLEPHVGWRSPWSVQSQGTYLIGSYYENSRWEGLPGKIHGTGGIAYKLKGYVEGLIGIDIAKDFLQLLITIR